MAEPQKSGQPPSEKGPSPKRGLVPLDSDTLTQVIRNLRLVWRLFWDHRVGLGTKTIPLLGIVYLISPIDLISDVVPVLGQLDDLAVIILSLKFFIECAPASVVKYHIQALLREEKIRENPATTINFDPKPTSGTVDPGDVVEGKFREE